MKLSKKKLQELKDNKISIEELNDRYFINSQYEAEVDNTLKLLNEHICSFKEIVDRFKRIKDEDDDPCLYKLIKKVEFFEELIENNKLNKDDTKALLNRIDKHYELSKLCENTILVNYIVDKGLFKELVDTFKSISELGLLLKNKELLKELIENNKLTVEYLRYLLNTIDKSYDLDKLCWYTSLIKYILNEFILDKDLVDRFNKIIENNSWCKYHYMHTIFDRIEYDNKNNEEILKLNELNKKVYLLNNFELTKDQKLEISEVLRDNEQSQNTLIQIVNTHLEDQYDFEQLKRVLTKDDKKSLKTKFNF